MLAVAGSFYLLSTAAFCLFCVAIGARLLLLSQRTGARPERLLGIGLGLTGGLGYGILIAVALSRQALGETPDALMTAANALGKAPHALGVAAMLAFVLTVFRPGVAWARALAGFMLAALLAGYVGYAAGGGFVHGRPEGVWYWLGFASIGTYPVWIAIESFLYHGMMRRRRALGLAHPLVVNRFLLWGIGALFSVAAIWTVSLPAVLGLPLAEQARLSPLVLSETALWGIGAISSYWLTFFPPDWYRARIASPAPR
jgi:hypothetical protein